MWSESWLNSTCVKDPLSSTSQVSSERRVTDLESEVPGPILIRGNILFMDFLFSCSKASDANIANFVNFDYFVKPPIMQLNSRPMRRIELYTDVCSGFVWVDLRTHLSTITQSRDQRKNYYSLRTAVGINTRTNMWESRSYPVQYALLSARGTLNT